VYAATETAGIASECSWHTGMHLYEDLVITEVVDQENRAVPIGTFGAKVLVTVLFSRTQPLIRYEMSDRVRLTDASCPCGRVFRMIDAVEGRTEDVLALTADDGTRVEVPPNLFHAVLEPIAERGWQVVQLADRLRVKVVDGPQPIDELRIISCLDEALRKLGVIVPIEVEHLRELPRTAIGKAPLIQKYATHTAALASEHSQPSTS